MPRILFVAIHRPGRSPSQRFRFEQYLTLIKSAGFDYDFSWLISEKDDRIFYKPGHLFSKGLILAKAIIVRFSDLMNLHKYDLVFVQREAFMTGSCFFEKMYSRSKARLIYDFDDAVWLYDVSEANKYLGWLKRPAKVSDIISVSDAVIAGNGFLAKYAENYSDNVFVIPTTIDTDYHKPLLFEKESKDVICIGWTGSKTTVKHFALIENALRVIKERYGDKVKFKLFGCDKYENPTLGIKGIGWTKENEVEVLREMDIGVMPLPNDEWSKGKCGFKALQYMAMEIPPVVSPIGVNLEIVEEGVSGFFADDETEWIQKLSKLIEDTELRRSVGKVARKIVIERYSVASQSLAYLNVLNSLFESKG